MTGRDKREDDEPKVHTKVGAAGLVGGAGEPAVLGVTATLN